MTQEFIFSSYPGARYRKLRLFAFLIKLNDDDDDGGGNAPWRPYVHNIVRLFLFFCFRWESCCCPCAYQLRKKVNQQGENQIFYMLIRLFVCGAVRTELCRALLGEKRCCAVLSCFWFLLPQGSLWTKKKTEETYALLLLLLLLLLLCVCQLTCNRWTDRINTSSLLHTVCVSTETSVGLS